MKFRLQRVLDLRRRKEDEMRQRLAVAVQARVRVEAELVRRLAAEAALREEIARLLGAGRVDAALVQRGGLSLDAAALAIRRAHDDVARALAFEEEERGQLTRAMIEREALDRLRTRHEERERQDGLRREATLLGEIATARAARERMGSARGAVTR